ncbi:hypothetical protein ACK33T_05990, partial [Aeromonas veronii]
EGYHQSAVGHLSPFIHECRTYYLNYRTTHNGRQWKAQYWTKGNEPGKHDVWQDVGAASCK